MSAPTVAYCSLNSLFLNSSSQKNEHGIPVFWLIILPTSWRLAVHKYSYGALISLWQEVALLRFDFPLCSHIPVNVQCVKIYSMPCAKIITRPGSKVIDSPICSFSQAMITTACFPGILLQTYCSYRRRFNCRVSSVLNPGGHLLS